MTSSAIRCLAVPCAGLVLLLAACAGVDRGKENCRAGNECAAGTPSVAAGHSEKPPDAAVQPVSYNAEAQTPAAVPLTGEQSGPTGPENLPAPSPANGGAPPNEPVRQISLPSALAAVSGQNPQVAYANARICESFAQAQAARVLWLPSIHAGLSYDNHGGTLQAVNGDVADASRSALEAGLGIGATGRRCADGAGRRGQLSRRRRHFPAANRRPRRRGTTKCGHGCRSRSAALGSAQLRRSAPRLRAKSDCRRDPSQRPAACRLDGRFRPHRPRLACRRRARRSRSWPFAGTTCYGPRSQPAWRRPIWPNS